MQRDLKALRDGAIAGAAATLTMSAVMLPARALGLLPSHPPKDLTEEAMQATGVAPQQHVWLTNALAVGSHFGFGAASGALFGVLHRRLRPPIPPVLHGIIFGTLMWAVSYKGWIPAIGVLPPPEKDWPGRVGVMLVAHWVFGATLGVLVAATERDH